MGSEIPHFTNERITVSFSRREVSCHAVPSEQDATTVGHVPDSLAEVLYKPLLEKEIKMTCRVSGQSRSAPEGVWVQGGGIEIPCFYEIGVKKGLRSLRKELRDKLIQLVPTTDNTI